MSVSSKTELHKILMLTSGFLPLSVFKPQRNKHLKYISLCVMNLHNMSFELYY